MTFHDAFVAERAARRAAIRAADLDYRCNVRYRLWLRPNDPAVLALCDRLGERVRSTREAAEEARWRLDRLWDDLSRRLSIAWEAPL